jgi:hypothetical protein
MSTARCTRCNHHPHPGRRCHVKRIDGPPSTQGRPTADFEGYEHVGRNETQCLCDTYQPHLNGVDPIA